MHHKTNSRQVFFPTRVLAAVLTLLLIAALTVTHVSAMDSGFSSPHRASSPGKSWTNISYSFASDDLYATARRNNKQLKLYNFTIPSIPGGATIDGIEVTVEGLTQGLQAKVELSYNGGSSFTDTYTTALTPSESVYTLGGPTDTWGHTWTPNQFTNTNFMMRLVTTGSSGATISIDQVRVKVYFTPPPTTLTLAPVSGPYAGTASMSATLTVTNGGAFIPGKQVNFFLGSDGIDANGECTGTQVGSAVTNSSGVATFANASLSGIVAGNYPYGACASFAGDFDYSGTSISGSLEIIGTGTTLTVSPATGAYGGSTSLSATLTMTSGGSGVNNQWVTFYLFGNSVGSAKTNNSGIATLSNISLVGYNAGTSNDVEASFEGDANLNPASAFGQITITPRAIGVTAVSSTKVYDGTVSSSGVPTITSGSLVTGDVAGFTQAFDTKDVGTGKTLTPAGSVEDGNSGQNYSVTFNSVSTGVINKALLTVTADDQQKFVGQQTDPNFSFDYSGLAGTDTGAEIDTPPVCSVTVPHDTLGTYPILCSGASDNNYNFSYVNGDLSVIYPHIKVEVGQALQGEYDVAAGEGSRQTYTNLNNGPAEIFSSNNARIIASQRVIYAGVSYSEMMGLPFEALTNEYLFPYYNNTAMSSQLRVSNLGGVPTTITVYLAGSQIDSFTLGAGMAERKNYAGQNNGPLRVTSSATDILTTVRVLYGDKSYSEMMGLPIEQLTDEYLFPYYNNVAMDSQLRVSNLGDVQTTITVYLAGSQIDSYTLGAGQAERKTYAGQNNGPLRVTSSATNILTSIRVLYGDKSYSEMMGLPVEQLSQEYWYPAYDNVNLSSQLRVGNVGDGPTTITVYLAGQQIDSYTLQAGQATRKTYPNNNGALRVVSSAESILSTVRMLYETNSFASLYEMMGVPGTQISTQYFFPWYNNSAMQSEIRFGVAEK